ncbi:hypothetical protein C474_08912 [Halogeometricum pallidum JCM 14848]|uniref:Uncharacterized protein n=1 Tax=Halogeometricum pallidum JCM 14848 TaxID=1227487 RepID=M0D7D3_HALPD|nr:hypothetical protein [Halogeometricum pallidum]ELZ31410.1 hypothetical protein C474_08912 [Halogeometricum pallidum JCM 14848]
MAGLSARLRTGCRGHGRDRGQLLLVGAFSLALLVVALAMILNGVASGEVLATDRTDVHDARDAVRFEHSVHRGIGGAVEVLNRRNDGSYADLDTALADSVDDWDEAAARGSAAEGVDLSVERVDWERGTRIEQRDSRTFTDANATENWTLASAVGQTRAFEMNVSRTNLSSSCTPECFAVVADDGTDVWRASFTQTASKIDVTVESPTETKTCSVSGASAVVDLSSGTVNDGTCSFPPFADGLGGSYDIGYENGTRADGTYGLVVDVNESGVLGVSPDRYDETAPTASPAVYAVTVSVTYQTPQLAYATELRVVPGETDA